MVDRFFLNLGLKSAYVSFFVFIFAILFSIKFYVLSNGNVLNHYPFISPDGFDWYTEGIYLVHLIQGDKLQALPVLRPPIFVFITALDYIFGGSGLILSVFYFLSITMTFFFMLWIIDMGCSFKNKDPWLHFSLAIAVTLYPINFIKGYLLSDSIAVCLSLFSVFMLMKYFNENKKYLLFFSGFIALSAGLTQTYALLPYLVFIVFRLIFMYKKSKANVLALFTNLSIIFLAFFLVSFIWRHTLSHGSTPQNFELLHLGIAMLSFYMNTWGYYFLPLIIFLFSIKPYKAFLIKNQSIMLSSAAVTFTLAFLCFIYQWPEARFTYYFWPWALITLFLFVKLMNQKNSFILLAPIMLITSFLVSPNPWQPSLRSLSLSYHKSWAINYFESQSVDRGLDNCNTTNCDGNEWLANSDQYVKSVIFMNLLLKKLDIKDNK
jgi:hypothetical protein